MKIAFGRDFLKNKRENGCKKNEITLVTMMMTRQGKIMTTQ